MRTLLSTLAALALSAGAAAALQSSDPAKAWKGASASERTALLAQTLGAGKSQAELAAVGKCLDEASNVPGHADLSLGELIKGCGSMSLGDPV